MELKPKEEMFVQSYLKHNGHGTQAYLDIHPGVKEVSARVNASRLLANISIRMRVSEILHQKGLGLDVIVKQLKELLRKNKLEARNNGRIYYYGASVRLEVIRIILKLHGYSDVLGDLSSEQIKLAIAESNENGHQLGTKEK